MKKIIFGILLGITIALIPYMIYGVPTVTWDETSPAGSDAASTIDNRIREHKTQIREIMSADHVMTSTQSGSTGGYHKTIRFTGAATDIGTGTSALQILGPQLDGADSELTYTDGNDSDVQITKDGALNAVALRGAIGGGTASAGTFVALTGTVVTASTSLTLATGATPTEFSTDGTMGGNSDTAVPTEKATKTYADTKAGALSATTINDSEANAMLASRASVAHSYTAQTDGIVTWSGDVLSGKKVTAYLDTDTDPVTGGIIVGQTEGEINGTQLMSLTFPVASGESFEILSSNDVAINEQFLTWKSFGTLSAPVDNN